MNITLPAFTPISVVPPPLVARNTALDPHHANGTHQEQKGSNSQWDYMGALCRDLTEALKVRQYLGRSVFCHWDLPTASSASASDNRNGASLTVSGEKIVITSRGEVSLQMLPFGIFRPMGNIGDSNLVDCVGTGINENREMRRRPHLYPQNGNGGLPAPR